MVGSSQAGYNIGQQEHQEADNRKTEPSTSTASLKSNARAEKDGSAFACTAKAVQELAMQQSCISAGGLFESDANPTTIPLLECKPVAVVEEALSVITSENRRQIQKGVFSMIKDRKERGLTITSPVSDTSSLVVEIDSPREQWQRYRWAKLSASDPIPSLRNYTIPKATRADVSDFLTEYCGAERDVAYALFLVDASGPLFNGMILLILRTVMDWSNPALFDSCSFEGEAFLVPDNHDPWLMIDMLADNGYVHLADERRSHADAGSWVEDMCFDAYNLACKHAAMPTMARLEAPELLWIAWSVHLRPILRGWEPYVEEAIVKLGYQCVNAFVIIDERKISREPGSCEGLVSFTGQLLAKEVERFLEEDQSVFTLQSPSCRCAAGSAI